MKLESEIPYLLTGKNVSKEDAQVLVGKLEFHMATKTITDIELRYKTRHQSDISDYQGLLLFCEVVKFLKGISLQNATQKELLLKAQKRVLHYHNLQYERTTKDGEPTHRSDSELPHKGADDKGKTPDLFQK